MIDPGPETFRALAETDGDRPTVVRASATLPVEVDPLTAYAALGEGEYAFLLESAEKTASSDPDGAFSRRDADRHARYSYVGYDPAAVATVDDGLAVEVLDDRYEGLLDPPDPDEGADPDVLDHLRRALPDARRAGFPAGDRQHLDGGLVGFLAYEAVYDLWLSEVGRQRPTTALPDARFVLTTRTLAFDHAEDRVTLVFTPLVGPATDVDALHDRLRAEANRVTELLSTATPPETDPAHLPGERAGDRESYERSVDRAKEAVLDGEIYQGVISRSRERTGRVDPLGLYDALRSVNPSPYMYLLGFGDRSVVGASPETLVSVDGDRVVANPIAGTCPRGRSPVEDRRLAGEMLADDKERAEHTMLVDLARNDVRRVAVPGSVGVPEFMNVLKYSHVQHIESTVVGDLAPEADAFDAVRSAFPAGTLTGAPKVRAMEIIADLERRPRGLYGGGVGYVSWTGDADFAIVIRTATVEHGVSSAGTGDEAVDTDHEVADRLRVRAGAGIVADSDSAAEYEETEQKMEGVLAAVERVLGADDGTDTASPDAADAVDGGDRR